MNVHNIISKGKFDLLLKIKTFDLEQLDDHFVIRIFRCRNSDTIKHVLDHDLQKIKSGLHSTRIIDICINFADRNIIDHMFKSM